MKRLFTFITVMLCLLLALPVQAGWNAAGWDGFRKALATAPLTIAPRTTGTYDLGTSTRLWRTLYVGNISLLNGETIDNATDDMIEFQGVSGTDDTDLRFDLDGTYPVLSSPTDSAVGISGLTYFDGAHSNTIATTTAGGTTGAQTQITHATNALTGELVGVRGNARVDTIDSPSGTVIGGKFQAGNMGTGTDLATATGVYVDVVNKIPSGATGWTNARGYEVSMDLNQGSSGNVNTVTNAYMFYGVYNLPTVDTYATVTNGYGAFIRNEAVGGTGQMLDAAFYADDKSHSGGIYGWDFGIDFSGVGANSGAFGTADIRGVNSETIDNNTDGSWDFGAANLVTTGTITITDVDTIPINTCRNGASGPAALSTLTSTYSVEVRDFDDAADEDVYCDWEVPFDLTGLTVKFRVVGYVTNSTGPSSEGVSFFLQGASIGDGDLISSTLGTAVESNFAAESHAQYDRVTTDWSGVVTVTDLLAGETVILKLYRDISDSDDDYAQDFGVGKLQIKYDRAVSND